MPLLMGALLGCLLLLCPIGIGILLSILALALYHEWKAKIWPEDRVEALRRRHKTG